MNTVSVKQCMTSLVLSLLAVSLLGCEPPDPVDPTLDTATDKRGGDAAPSRPAAVQGKPSAPVSVDYEIVGTPVVGEPTQIDLNFASSEAEALVYATYRIPDSSALTFVDVPGDKTPVEMQQVNGGSTGRHRLQVTPHSDGRHYVNVLAEIETELGSLTKSTSIPIEVASLGAQLQSKQSQQTREAEAQVDSSGEAIISMPATENKN